MDEIPKNAPIFIVDPKQVYIPDLGPLAYCEKLKGYIVRIRKDYWDRYDPPIRLIMTTEENQTLADRLAEAEGLLREIYGEISEEFPNDPRATNIGIIRDNIIDYFGTTTITAEGDENALEI